ncbi:ANTH-domain-containing protein [Cylindrobasidium torrendii FP15055 ss-10]|uniref:ANTH-domain-containing protein n=1 Tax=Cylindrobasidium torrendii FP15055 ss-10 TaxID=1314674 RepID=A0A0D7BEH8_9AGAR|nr:ANTH-domain-containing protein [Cylindrobasidium torrendii FP15055 ss-10]
MSSYDKVVKLACKPKAAPPKAKYLDPIIAATWSEDGAVHDVCKALSPRFREPNAIVVFKALIVLHTMIRNGATDNVLSYLSQNDVLRLRNVSAGNWEGYSAPANLQAYAIYLDTRIKAYKDLKHDAVRVQAESNRDMRNSASIEEDGYRIKKGVGRHPGQAPVPTRSKTVMGRKLRSMTVEKGLLRETKAVHRMVDSLVECRFYLDDLEDELTITALRMLVKDLLILFQAGNEGVINLLEHYFEMSHVDARDALAIYRHFCQQAEKVVEYLGVAKKLQNLLNVPIPNLKHAPVSLAGALQEYLDDANFEQNRLEYRANKEAADKPGRRGDARKPGENPPPVPAVPTITASVSAPAGSPSNKDAVTDFFNSIEQGQPTMFNPNTNSPSSAYFHQQGAINPFVQMQMTGQPFVGQQPQMTGQPFMQMQPQMTGNPFGLQQQQAPSHLRPQPVGLGPGGHRPFTSFIPNQPTGAPMNMGGSNNMLQPQMTGGANPFRVSMVAPQSTGMALFGVGPGGPMSAPLQAQATATPWSQQQQIQQPAPAFSQNVNNGMNVPPRPGSAPINSAPPIAQPVKTHLTGTKNPFGRPKSPPPPMPPKAPTLLDIAMNQAYGQQQQQQQQTGMPQQQQQLQSQPTGNGFSFGNSALNPGAADIAGVASSFVFDKTGPSGLSSQNTSTSSATTAGSDSIWGSSSLSSQVTGASTALSSQMTGGSALSGLGGAGQAPLKPQTTGGLAGLKAFKPTSSFGASLLESLPPIPEPGANGSGSQPGTPGTPGTNGTPSFLASQPTGLRAPFMGGGIGAGGAVNGATTGVGLRPQMTGGNPLANPFRASMMDGNGNGNAGGVNAQPTGAFGAQPFGAQPTGAFGAQPTGAFGQQNGGGGSSGFGNGGSFGQQMFGGQQQQQPQPQSLI